MIKKNISSNFGLEKARSLQLVLEYLVRILRVNDNKVFVIYLRMVHT